MEDNVFVKMECLFDVILRASAASALAAIVATGSLPYLSLGSDISVLNYFLALLSIFAAAIILLASMVYLVCRTFGIVARATGVGALGVLATALTFTLILSVISIVGASGANEFLRNFERQSAVPEH